MNIKINFLEIVSIVILSIYLTNASIPHPFWEMESIYPTAFVIAQYIICIIILVPLLILYNGLKHKEQL